MEGCRDALKALAHATLTESQANSSRVSSFSCIPQASTKKVLALVLRPPRLSSSIAVR
jgi:hypothetical protein